MGLFFVYVLTTVPCTILHFLYRKISNEKQGPHVFSFTLLVMLGTMNLLALLP